MKTLYIIRGVPGSGKSTLAHKLTDNVVEADQFMYVNGEYKWAANKLHYAHSMCKRTVEDYMIEGRDVIAVANTFIKRKDVQPYIDLAKEYGYKVIQKVCTGNYQNVHNVPQETVEKMRKKFQESIDTAQLNEGIEDVQKYFPKMNLENIKKLVALDPTYKGGNELGKYGKWIIKLAYNNIKNIENKNQFVELMKRFPNGINPKNGQKFQAPQLLPAIKDEDLYKIKDSLKQYDILKREIGKPIDSFKTLPELDTAIESIKKQSIPTNEFALKRYNLMKKAVQKGLKIVFEDDKWIVGIPETKESSCMFGSDTKWCTTSNGWNYYEDYSEQGPLYINLNKESGELYQFHFETSSFMDENDKPISFDEIISSDKSLKSFYFQKVDKIFEDKNKVVKYFDYLRDIEISNDTFTGRFGVEDLDIVYTEEHYGRQSPISLKFIQEILSGEGWDLFMDSYDSSLQDMMEYNEGKFNEYIKPLNISWRDIIYIVRTRGETETKVITPKISEKIYDLIISDDYDPDYGNMAHVLSMCYDTGAYDEAYKTILNEIKENLPVDLNNLINDNYLNIKMPIDMAKQIVMTSLTDDDYYSEDNWLTRWRKIKGLDDKFNIYEPDYGYSGFDEETWNQSLKNFAEKIKEMIKEDNDAKSSDKDINEVLKLAGIKLEENDQPLEEMAYPTNFDLQFFSQLPSFKARIQYCEERLQKLGSGSSRTAYKVDDEKVLKIAKNKKGIAQNEHEADWGRNNYNVFAKIYEADTDNYTWIEMELARKAKASDFKKLTGLTFKEICEIINYIKDIYAPSRYPIFVLSYNKEELDEFFNEQVYTGYNEFIYDLYTYMTDYQPQTVGDWKRLANWGIVNRNGQEFPVIIDDGLSEDVYNNFYRR